MRVSRFVMAGTVEKGQRNITELYVLTSGTIFAAEAPNVIDNTQSIQNVISTVNGQANKMQGVRV